MNTRINNPTFVKIDRKTGIEINTISLSKWPRQESNLNLKLRKLPYYPLYYEA